MITEKMKKLAGIPLNEGIRPDRLESSPEWMWYIRKSEMFRDKVDRKYGIDDLEEAIGALLSNNLFPYGVKLMPDGRTVKAKINDKWVRVGSFSVSVPEKKLSVAIGKRKRAWVISDKDWHRTVTNFIDYVLGAVDELRAS